MIRVMLVDDHAVVRTGFRLLLQSVSDVSVIGEAESGEVAIAKYAELDARRRGDGSGDARPRRARSAQAHSGQARAGAESSRCPRMTIPSMRGALCRRGALGFLSKRSAPEALIKAVTTVAAGRRYLDADLAQKLALADLQGGTKSPVERLSEREFDVFIRLASGATVQKIAEELKVSSSTVGTHLYNIKQKLDVVNQSS